MCSGSGCWAQAAVDVRGIIYGEGAGLQSGFDLAPLSTTTFQLSNTPKVAARVFGQVEVTPHITDRYGTYGVTVRLLTNESTIRTRRQGIVPFDSHNPIFTRIRPERVIDFDRLQAFYDNSLGHFEVGWAEGPSERTAVSGPIDWGIGGYGGDFPYFLRKPQDVGFYSLSSFGSANTSPRAAYYSPRYFGLQGAVSYQPDTRNTGFDFNYGGTSRGVIGRQFLVNGTKEGYTAGFRDVVEAALNYDDVFGEFRVRGSAGVIQGTAISSPSGNGYHDLLSGQVGLAVSYAGWTAGVGYVNAGSSGYALLRHPRQRAIQFEVNGGLQYETGPWTIGVGALYGDAAGDPTERSDTQLTVISGGARYQLTRDWDVGLELTRIRTLSADFGDYTNYLLASRLAYRFQTR